MINSIKSFILFPFRWLHGKYAMFKYIHMKPSRSSESKMLITKDDSGTLQDDIMQQALNLLDVPEKHYSVADHFNQAIPTDLAVLDTIARIKQQRIINIRKNLEVIGADGTIEIEKVKLNDEGQVVLETHENEILELETTHINMR